LPELGFAPTGSFEAWDREVRARAEARLEPLLARARAACVEAEALLVPGFPDEAIVETARQRGADLIVVGTHGRRGAARLMLGSVAARVVAGAPCPVLTARG
jgi:nucleotide-binding universal stress UspA family protein